LNRPWYITAGLALGIFCGYSFVALERDAGASEAPVSHVLEHKGQHDMELPEFPECVELEAQDCFYRD
jgi:hypothetical protein